MSGTKKEVGAIVHRSGVSFRVWAPFASSVAVTGSFNDWSETAMESEKDGYWFVKLSHAQAGQEYRYIIMNGEQRLFKNDPRALQVTTAAGNSVIVDTNFEWSDDDFEPIEVNKQVIYELHVGTFYRSDQSTIGTFDEVTEKLDYLQDLGVTTIELMPISTMSPVREWWGYTPMYIYTVEAQYGGRHKFLEFVNEAHKRGISVVLDVVYNHLGPADLDIWQFDGWSENGKGGIYFYNDWRSKTPWGETRPDFGRVEVRQYLLDNVKMWMHDCHLDGLRVDSTIFIRNAKGNNDDPANDLAEGWQLLQQINSIAHKINPAALTIAEDVAANEYIVKPQGDGGAGFGAQWELGFPGILREVLKSDDPMQINLAGICSELGRGYNGDTFQRVIYTDSHDSAANGSARLNEVIAPGKADDLFARKQSIIAAGLLLTTPGIPMLFQGQEFMENGSFNDWEGLDWARAERNQLITDAYRHLIALRKNDDQTSAGLTGRNINQIHADDTNKVIGYHRWQNGGPRDDVMVLVNFANKSHQNYELAWPRDGVWKIRFSAWPAYAVDGQEASVDDVTVKDGKGTIVMPPSSVLILSQDE
jgi:1,4-alpha-glucan branching enzyme